MGKSALIIFCISSSCFAGGLPSRKKIEIPRLEEMGEPIRVFSMRDSIYDYKKKVEFLEGVLDVEMESRAAAEVENRELSKINFSIIEENYELVAALHLSEEQLASVDNWGFYGGCALGVLVGVLLN